MLAIGPQTFFVMTVALVHSIALVPSARYAARPPPAPAARLRRGRRADARTRARRGRQVAVVAKFKNGQPAGIEAKYVMKSTSQWDRFMRFMQRYAEDNNLGFNKS